MNLRSLLALTLGSFILTVLIIGLLFFTLVAGIAASVGAWVAVPIFGTGVAYCLYNVVVIVRTVNQLGAIEGWFVWAQEERDRQTKLWNTVTRRGR